MVDVLKINPVVTFIYFFSIVLISMFTRNIIIGLMSLVASISYYYILEYKIEKGFVASNLIMFFTIIILNGLWNHRGATELFFIKNQAVTFESLFYGLTTAIMIMSSIFWFRIISKFFTSDKLLYIFNNISPKLALLLTISIRFVDMYIAKFKSIDDAVKGIGYYKDYSIVDIIKTKCYVFSALVTWALENGIITSDSMISRGFGLKKRTSFYMYEWTNVDKIILFIIIIFDILNVLIINFGYLSVEFYPRIIFNINILYYAPFIIFTMMYLFIIINWRIRWHYMMLKI